MGMYLVEVTKAARAAAALAPSRVTYEDGHLVCDDMTDEEMAAAIETFSAGAWAAQRKAAAKAKLAQLAEAARQRYISDGAGKAAVYGLKREEAKRWASTNGEGGASAYPWMRARAERLGVEMSVVASEWLAKADAWETVGRAIEDAYEIAVEDVDALPDTDQLEVDIAAIVAAVTWP